MVVFVDSKQKQTTMEYKELLEKVIIKPRFHHLFYFSRQLFEK